MFESVGSSNNPSTIRRSSFIVVAIAFHVGLVVWLYGSARAIAEEPTTPHVTVVFHRSPPPAPPPPAAARRHESHHEKHEVVHKAYQMVVPKVIPTQLPKADDDSVDDGVPGGVPGGVKGGVPGGDVTGQLAVQSGTGEPAAVYLQPGMIAPKELDPEACHPRYPKQAQIAGIHGMVIAEYTVTRAGRATNIRIERVTNPVFAGAVRRALQHCRFQPATNKGRPISVILIRNFRFQLPQ